MKKKLALLIALLMLTLCACGQKSAPTPDHQNSVTEQTETQQDQPAELTEEGYYVQNKTLEDGGSITIYRNGGPEGAVVKAFVTYIDGTWSEERYDNEGNLEYMTWDEPDGTIVEMFYYPSGNTEKYIAKHADGAYEEIHYMDNGTFDEKTGIGYDGTITYLKTVAADGYVEEITYDIEEDGTRWDTDELDDGTIIKTHYGANGMRLEEFWDNEKTGDHTEIQYFDNGNEKSRDSYHADSKQRIRLEYYENNSVKYSLIEGDNGSKSEEKLNEAGYTTYYFENFNNQKACEFFANDNGELTKYVEEGVVYEGNAIPASAIDIFNQVRKTPAPAAENTVTTQEADGTTCTTTTYADGSTTTVRTAADGRPISNEKSSPTGEGYYEEYFESGKLKISIQKTADMFQELHYDEEGYWTYFHYNAGGYETEITTDETGKVSKVLLNGVEQTDIENYVKDMFFRSW